MNGFNVSEAGHVVQVIIPASISGGVIGQAFSMANYKHASIIISIGAQAAQATKIILSVGTATAAQGTAVANVTAIPFNLYKQESASADVLTAINNIVAAGYQPSATADIFYVIEIDANELEATLAGALTGTDGQFNYLQLSITNGANADFVSAVAILSGSRYAEAQSPTAIA
jgi:hypothetical protein